MNPWPFVIAAYGVTLLSAGVMSWISHRAMRRAERALDQVTKR